MRCKVGDLVAVVKAPGMSENIGRLGTVIEMGWVNSILCWSVQPANRFWSLNVRTGEVAERRIPALFPDDWLRPLRHPGDDAVDEMARLEVRLTLIPAEG